jgi:hypothetical protein
MGRKACLQADWQLSQNTRPDDFAEFATRSRRRDFPQIPDFCRPARVACVGSSGMKRRGRRRQPKVGTRPEREYALHEEQRAVAAQFGLAGKGWMFWTALAVVVALVAFGVLGLAFFF